MKIKVLTFISTLTFILCIGATNNLSAQSPYNVDNTIGKYVDMSNR